MDFQTYARIPFTVEAVEITEDNLSEVAEMIGTLQQDSDGTNYILVERKVWDKKFVPNILKVYVGWWVTKMGDHTRCYSPKVFRRQFQRLVEPAQSFNAAAGSVEVTITEPAE